MNKETVSIADQLRICIREAPISRYRISILTGISQAALSRFMTRGSGLSLDSINKIGQVLHLKLTVRLPEIKGDNNDG
jgi:hypothetical protein